jgi:hypothetical protein
MLITALSYTKHSSISIKFITRHYQMLHKKQRPLDVTIISSWHARRRHKTFTASDSHATSSLCIKLRPLYSRHGWSCGSYCSHFKVRWQILSSTDETSSDLEGVGKVCYRPNLEEKTYCASQKRMLYIYIYYLLLQVGLYPVAVVLQWHITHNNTQHSKQYTTHKLTKTIKNTLQKKSS